MRIVSYVLVCCCVVATACMRLEAADDAADDAAMEQLFENSIRPVLIENCFRCHGDPQAKLAGGLHVDSREGLLTGGDSGAAINVQQATESLLLQAIKRIEPVSPMPPDADQALRPEQVAAFEKWIAAGAPWPKSTGNFQSQQHWAFKPLQVAPSDAGPLAIDHFIQAKQQAVGLQSAPVADKRTLIRRATFDLTGLPPTPAAIQAFESNDSDEAYARLIDELLASPHYGERWGRHWLDVVRYADTAGETADYPVPNAWRYRNWVIAALNRDMPYDQFLREQIAGDVLAAQDSDAEYAEHVTATGYLAISRRFGFDSENYHHLTIQDTIDTVGQSVLGLSLGCARCHDHKFDPISMQDYYGLYGIFDSSRYAFPGSEQKQRVRTMMPLVPPRQAMQRWREFAQTTSSLRQTLEQNQQPVPNAVLRMLTDMDGDFELQAPAAGGSNGVLVPPWSYSGPIAVTAAAQSPYKNAYSSGKVGASIPALTDGVTGYVISQAIYPRRTAGTAEQAINGSVQQVGHSSGQVLVANFDFRVGASEPSVKGEHEMWLGAFPDSPALVLAISRTAIIARIPSASTEKTVEQAVEQAAQQVNLAEVVAGQWINVQLRIDLRQRLAAISIHSQTGTKQHDALPLSDQWRGAIDHLQFQSGLGSTGSGGREAKQWPPIELDNVAIAEGSIPSIGEQPASAAPNAAPPVDMAKLSQQINQLVGIDSDYELQTVDMPPSAPWNMGPNSVVKIMTRAQSPAINHFPLGKLGVHMPNRAEYDGYGIALPTTWKAETTNQLFTSFDFRCADKSAGGNGSWRYYVGHGPGNSAAVELYFNGEQLFQRSGDARSPVTELTIGRWYQVELALDLKARQYTGVLRPIDGDEPSQTKFGGQLATGWDGVVDHSFIDSYGHIGGVRPALDVDNYVVSDQPLADQLGSEAPTEQLAKREQVRQLRDQLSQAQGQLKGQVEQLNQALINGPFDMAYAVAEGTPHDVAVQLRGEPSQPGDVVPRGFIRVLGGDPLPHNASGSGRYELAKWLTHDTVHLTARVMANRLWQYHFGRGLVRTPNDFGVRGQRPTHPELLDYLAAELIKSGWSLKAMHRQIMLSQTYKQASLTIGTNSPTAQETLLDPSLYVGFAHRRLSAEEIRDAILEVSSLLDRSPGTAHPFAPPTTWGYSQHAPFSAVYDHQQRSVYLMTQRLKRHPFLALFDGADPNASTADRLGSTVPTQALYFLNDPFVHRATDAWATGLGATAEQATAQIQSAYWTALARPARPDEVAAAEVFLDEYASELQQMNATAPKSQALAAFLRTLIGSNEFLHVD